MAAPMDTAETTPLFSTLIDSIYRSIDEPTIEISVPVLRNSMVDFEIKNSRNSHQN
ncbi:hypothetical protein C1H46_006061 [Malus baccata]|uniref:Uncharacterized protein n=1 Tax=Malus baccata TaxID=106549 RepID=A0A540NB64_MALBA|nr:hypothetical protein C1H46_006061 [Malus baccata]